MRILVAPDKFKDCLTAVEVAAAISLGLLQADPSLDIDSCPMADGGEGTVDALVAATGGRFETARVTGPLPEMKVDARFGILGDGKTAVVELAAASGLALLKPEDRNPLATTTFGTGELLMAAAARGVQTIILGIGGSATLDAGIGIAQACGLPVILQDGQPLSPTEPLVGADVEKVVLIKHGRGSPIEKIRIVVARDVTNPLLGPSGAAAVFGPQKGATSEQIPAIDAALRELARRNGKLAQADLPGAGAAGGVGFAMGAFFGASLQSGAQIVADAVKLRDRLQQSKICFTGEGRLDAQSLAGKVVAAVAGACAETAVPCYALTGSIDRNVDLSSLGLAGAFAIADGSADLRESLAHAENLLAATTQRVWRNIVAPPTRP